MTKESEYLNNLTLIIPTYNRPEFLARLIKYYASKKTDIKFLILDSSDEKIQPLNQKSCVVLGNSITYVNFSHTIPVATKLLEGLKLVTTDFTAFCADDDLVFIDGLSSALTFLINNPQYVCVDGIYLNFNQIENNIHLVIEYATKGISAENPGARLFQLYQKYESLFYGVFKKNDAIAIFTGVSQNTSLHYQELFQATAALLLGKSHRLPIFYAARQHCDPAEVTRDKWQTYYWFADNAKEFLEHYVIYRKILWKFYLDNIQNKTYSQNDFFKMIDIVHAMYFGIGCPPAYFHSVLENDWPNDPFKKPNIYTDNVCNLLKTAHRNWLEIYFEKFSTWFSKKLSQTHSKRDLTKLDKLIHKESLNQWKCHLNKDLRWLARVELFKSTYQELCHYLDKTPQKQQV